MADNTNIIVVGNVAFTDQGTWKSRTTHMKRMDRLLEATMRGI